MMMPEFSFYAYEIEGLTMDETIARIKELISDIHQLESIVKDKNKTYFTEPSFDIQLSYNEDYLIYSMSRIIFENTKINDNVNFDDWFQKFEIPENFKTKIINYSTTALTCYKQNKEDNSYTKINDNAFKLD